MAFLDKKPAAILDGEPYVASGSVAGKLEEATEAALDAFNKEKEEHILRSVISRKMSDIFVMANIIILAMVCIIYAIDTLLLINNHIEPADRTVDSKTIYTLIGATTVQLGALMAIMAGWLFKKNKNPGL